MNEHLTTRFPWLNYLKPTADQIVDTLFKKEQHYEGSWQRRGGIGAFMMLARKWDRLESIAVRHKYDIFEAGELNTADIRDDIDDLIGYLLLVRSEVRRRTVEEPGLPLQGQMQAFRDNATAVEEPVSFRSVRRDTVAIEELGDGGTRAEAVAKAEQEALEASGHLPADEWDNVERPL